MQTALRQRMDQSTLVDEGRRAPPLEAPDQLRASRLNGVRHRRWILGDELSFKESRSIREVAMTGDGGDTDTEARVSRRGLLKWGGAIGIAVAVPAVGTAIPGPAVAAQTGPSTAVAAGAAPLSAEQNAVLEAFVERLIPADATGPGAIEAGVATFIARSLEGGLAGSLGSLVPLYTANLSAVDAYAMTAYGGAFTSLSAATRGAVLTDIASGRPRYGFTQDSATFFATIREHTLEGMFSDPAYGGNSSSAGWELIGYPGVRNACTGRRSGDWCQRQAGARVDLCARTVSGGKEGGCRMSTHMRKADVVIIGLGASGGYASLRVDQGWDRRRGARGGAALDTGGFPDGRVG